jgi:Polyketide cyclase / dehydrase and lipid transport
MRHSYTASRTIALPGAKVFEVATMIENLIWMKGCLEPSLKSGDGTSPGSVFVHRDLVGREVTFEILERANDTFRIRNRASSGVLEGELSVASDTDASCTVTWTSHDRPEHLIERVLVVVSGPYGKRASARDAESELERLEQVVRWHLAGRNGPPLGADREALLRLIR